MDRTCRCGSEGSRIPVIVVVFLSGAVDGQAIREGYSQCGSLKRFFLKENSFRLDFQHTRRIFSRGIKAIMLYVC